MPPPKYQQIRSSEEKLLGESQDGNENSGGASKSKSLPWICSTICLLSLLAAQSIYITLRPSNTYEKGFATDFRPSIPAIDVVEVQFTGSLAYTETGHLYIDVGEDGVRYFGQPSDEVDQAWQDLLGEKLTFPMTEEDAKAFNASSKHPVVYPGLVGLDVLHTLHCVNEVRKILDSEHYYKVPLKDLKRNKRVHIDHCLNHIRQVIQCHMDLTPVTSMYFESMNTYVGNFDQVHTCRDISKLQEWKAERISKKVPSFRDLHPNSSGGYIDSEEDALLSWYSTESEFE